MKEEKKLILLKIKYFISVNKFAKYCSAGKNPMIALNVLFVSILL